MTLKNKLWLDGCRLSKIIVFTTLLLVPIAIPSVALAQTALGKRVVLQGNDKGALPCAECHGANGVGNPSMGVPALAGLPVPVLEIYLKRYAAGQSDNAIMQHEAMALSPGEMVAVAEYFAGLGR